MTEQTEIRNLLGQLQQQRIILSRLFVLLEEERKKAPSEFLDEIKQILSGIDYSIGQLLMQLEKGVARPGEEKSLARMTQYAVSKIRRIPFGLRPMIVEDLNELAKHAQ